MGIEKAIDCKESKTILVVEDSPVQVFGVFQLLEQHCLNVQCAQDGAAGIALAQKSHSDLTILDIQMPEMNGNDAKYRSFITQPGKGSGIAQLLNGSCWALILTELFREPIMSLQQNYNIRSEYDIINARMQVREAARTIGMDLADQARLSLATSSLLDGLGLGLNSDSSSVSIESLSEGQNKGLRVICTFHDSREHRPVKMATGKVGWMVDIIAIRNLADDLVEISMTKWVMRRQQ